MTWGPRVRRTPAVLPSWRKKKKVGKKDLESGRKKGKGEGRTNPRNFFVHVPFVNHLNFDSGDRVTTQNLGGKKKDGEECEFFFVSPPNLSLNTSPLTHLVLKPFFFCQQKIISTSIMPSHCPNGINFSHSP